jgi:hypothetical protein
MYPAWLTVTRAGKAFTVCENPPTLAPVTVSRIMPVTVTVAGAGGVGDDTGAGAGVASDGCVGEFPLHAVRKTAGNTNRLSPFITASM